MTIKVRIREADLMPRIVQLSDPVLTIGRSNDCAIRLTNPSISRHHARIEYAPASGYVLSDAGSRAGTLLNDRPVQKAMVLRQGDEIGIGEARIVILELDHDAQVLDKPKEPPEVEKKVTSKSDAESAVRVGDAVVVLPPSAPFEPSKTQLASSVHAIIDESDEWSQVYDQAVEAVRSDFENFWKAVKARTPYSLAGQMQALRDAVDGGIMRLAQVAETVKESRDRLEKLLEASQLISAPLPLRERLETILDMAIEKLDADCGFLMLYSQRTESLRLALQRGMPELESDLDVSEKSMRARGAGERMAQETFKSGATQIRLAQIRTQGDSFLKTMADHGIHCAICSPMRVKSRFLGLIYVDFRDPRKAVKPIGTEDAKWLDGLAALSALAIENARLIEQQKIMK